MHAYGEMHTRGASNSAREPLEAALAIFRRLEARKPAKRVKQGLATLPNLRSLSSGRSRSRRDAAERSNDRRRAHNVSIDGLNQAIVGQPTLLEMLSAESVERKDIVVPLAYRGRARP